MRLGRRGNWGNRLQQYNHKDWRMRKELYECQRNLIFPSFSKGGFYHGVVLCLPPKHSNVPSIWLHSSLPSRHVCLCRLLPTDSRSIHLAPSLQLNTCFPLSYPPADGLSSPYLCYVEQISRTLSSQNDLVSAALPRR